MNGLCGVIFFEEEKYSEKKEKNVENFCEECAQCFLKAVEKTPFIFVFLQGDKVLHDRFLLPA